MTKRETYEKRTEELILPILDEMSFELVDIEYVKEGSDYYLRAYIDKIGGITIDDCVTVSRKMNDLLDEYDYIEDQYTFEVSSPGLDRQLKKEKDFLRSIGKKVRVHTYTKIDGKKEFVGILSSYDSDSITLIIDDINKTFNKDNVSLVKLYFEI